MSVSVSLSLADEEFSLQDAFREMPTAHIEFERVVPRGEGFLPYTWVHGADAATVRAAIEATDDVRGVTVLDELPDRTLVRIDWEPTINGVFAAITEQEAAILNASGDADRWRFELRFPTTEAASHFQQQCHETGLTIDITTVHDTTQPETARTDKLTADQRDALNLALDGGYFEIPRRTTLVDLADRLGVSDQAVSERLRRAQTKLSTIHLDNEIQRPQSPRQ